MAMAHAALDAKAEELVILDLRKLTFSFDFFFLCSAASDRRIKTVADHVEEALFRKGHKPRHVEGQPEGGWFLMDFGPVVAHIFSPEARRYYELERLWADAPRLRVPKSA